MKLERLSAWAELVSSVAIVATLAYLAVQTQQNTEALQASARQASLDTEIGLIMEIINDPILYDGELLELSDKSYTNDELIKISAYGVAFFRTRENYWLQYRSGALDRETWESYRSVLVDVIGRTERYRKVWSMFSNQFDPGFVAELNSYLPD